MVVLFEFGAVTIDVHKGLEVCNALSVYCDSRFEVGLGKHPPDVVLNGAFLVPRDSWVRKSAVCEG